MENIKRIEVLNLYGGYGGNVRLLDTDQFNITTIENNPKIVKTYKKMYPNHTVICEDAEKYFIENFKKFDVIWVSYPCPTHSRARFWAHSKNIPILPDMKLYSYVIFLQTHFKGNWIVENVIPYYKPLIKGIAMDRHYFWSNKRLKNKIKLPKKDFPRFIKKDWIKFLGFEILDGDIIAYRNCVHPRLGRYIIKQLVSTKTRKKF